jgi:Transglycosylase SLT domain
VLGLVLGLLQATDAYALPRSEAIPRTAYAYRAQLIREARYVWGLSAPTSTFSSQIHAESGWNPNARNRRSKAAGLSQFMSPTAKWLSRRYPELGSSAPLNATWAIRAMLRYNREIYRMTRAGTPCEKAGRMLAGYNFGPGRMYKHWPRETQRYVHRILQILEPVYVANGWGLGSCS